MMRGKKVIAVSVRREDGSISTVVEPLDSFFTGKLREIPFVRGITVLSEALIVGVRSILVSAQEYAGPEEKISGGYFWSAMAIGLGLAVGLFFVLPLVIVQFFDRFLTSSFLSNLVEGVVRLGLFVAYLYFISFMRDIRRVFAYHGAEHKVVNAHEAGAPLEVPSVREYSTAHARCGTGFILVVLLLSIILFALLGRPSMPFRIASRILFIPVIAAAGYELIRFAAGHTASRLIRAVLLPGLALQAMTTRQPDDGQVEVALTAFKRVLAEDAGESGVQGPEPGVQSVESVASSK